jgi:hypothetical protein
MSENNLVLTRTIGEKSGLCQEKQLSYAYICIHKMLVKMPVTRTYRIVDVLAWLYWHSENKHD